MYKHYQHTPYCSRAHHYIRLIMERYFVIITCLQEQQSKIQLVGPHCFEFIQLMDWTACVIFSTDSIARSIDFAYPDLNQLSLHVYNR